MRTNNTFTYLLSILFLALSGQVFAQQGPQADFTWSPNPPCAGQAIQFRDQSTNFVLPFGYYYDFGDGNSASNNPDPTHTYATAGTYNVWYCVLDSATWDSSCVSKTIVVNAGPCATPDTITGQVYFDVNGNGSFDGGDYPLSNKRVDISGFQVSTDANGVYSLASNAGTFTVGIANPAPFTVSTPTGGTYSHTLSGNGSVYSGDFGLTVNSNIQDLSVSVAHSAFRPGFNPRIWLTYTNEGTTVMSGSVTLTYDDSLTYIQSTPNAAHNPSTRTLGYAFTNLLPSESRLAVIEVNVAATVPLGTWINGTASINPVVGDADTSNNTAYIADTTRGSYDPNDKAVFPGEGVEGYVLPDTRLNYRIRFQNTGTDTAFTVVIVDTLPGNLDISTLDLQGASHGYTFSLDEAQRIMTWTFDNILLPDSNTNEPASHGFVQFAIDMDAALPDFTTIQNRAAIYFDFNAPIITNYTLTTINSATSISGGESFQGLQMFPNPTQGKVWLRFDNDNQQAHNLSIMDTQGRILRQHSLRGNEIEVDMEGLASGMYLFRLVAEDGRSAVGKIILK